MISIDLLDLYQLEIVSLGHLVDQLEGFLEWCRSHNEKVNHPRGLMEKDYLHLVSTLSKCPYHGYRECWCRYRLLQLVVAPEGERKERLYRSCLTEYQELLPDLNLGDSTPVRQEQSPQWERDLLAGQDPI